MRTRIEHVTHVLFSSYWFVPTVMLLAAVLVEVVLVRVDRGLDDDTALGNWLYGGGPEGARGLLEAIAGTVITVGGVVFSITILTLTQASSQFGPRLLRNFMRDLGNQVVLGTFVATFIYCLLVLRTIRANDDDEFVPHLSVTIAIAFALLSLAVLIYFIHHVSTMLQAPRVIENVWNDLMSAIERLYPEQLAEPAEQQQHDRKLIEHRLAESSHIVRARESGYVQIIEPDRLMDALREHDLCAQLLTRPGKFVSTGEPIARVHPRDRCVDEGRDAINDALVLSAERTSEQDAEFAIDQLVEIAVRALSPSMNDPFTAINVLDRLAPALSTLAGRRFPAAVRADKQHAPRLIVDATDFGGICDAAFNMIRQNGTRSVSVSIRLLEAIEKALISCPRIPDDRVACLVKHADMALTQAMEQDLLESDREDLRQRMERVRQASREAVKGAA